MRVLLIPDVSGWAIGNLCKSIERYNPHLNIEIIPCHPRAVGDAIMPINEALDRGVDVVHFQYWNSAIQLMELLPRLRDPKIKKVLTHHNHYRLTKSDWSDFDIVTEATDWGVDVLSKVHENVKKVPYGIDLDRFSYIDQYPPAEPMVGYVGRICSWKNLGEICRVSKELGYKVLGTGYIDKADYWETIDKSNLEWHGGAGMAGITPANIKDDLYSRMTVFVMYATEEKESGTLPMLEAMARGIPVMVTEQGMARDILKDGENAIFFTPENFKEKLKMLMEDEPLRIKLRQAAWNTIKKYPEEMMAREFCKVYHQALGEGLPLISTIITSYNRPDALLESILSIDRQDYPAKEIVVADDGSTDPRVKLVVEQAQQMLHTPIRFIENKNKQGYGLGKMRNLAVMEALGSHILIFQDRFTLDEGMLEHVVASTKLRTWGYGSKRIKGEIREKKAFIENFAWILKEDLMLAGGFSERVDIYGGQSEEVRNRFKNAGYVFNQIPNIVATEIASSGAANRRSDIWKAKLEIAKMTDHVK